MLKANQNGTAVIESLVGMGLSLLLFGSTLILLYFSFAFIWTKHSLYQGVLCRVEGQSAQFCQNDLKKKIKLALPVGQLKKISLIEEPLAWSGTLEWRLNSSVGLNPTYKITRKQILRAAKNSDRRK